MWDNQAPIGIFDSGVGGLTVARAIADILPQENLLYVGDTAHLPYGDKSADSIQSYAKKITGFLLDNHCKFIIIACNSASAVAGDLVREIAQGKAGVLDVISPLTQHLNKHHTGERIGLIGTKQTIASRAYHQQLVNCDLQSQATPLLAPIIEEGLEHEKLIHEAVKIYLSAPGFQSLQALILGCTHYPLITTQIQNFYGEQAPTIIDASAIVAQTLKNTLIQQQNLSPQTQTGFRRCLLTNPAEGFSKTAKRFFGDTIQIEQLPLWQTKKTEN